MPLWRICFSLAKPFTSSHSPRLGIEEMSGYDESSDQQSRIRNPRNPAFLEKRQSVIWILCLGRCFWTYFCQPKLPFQNRPWKTQAGEDIFQWKSLSWPRKNHFPAKLFWETSGLVGRRARGSSYIIWCGLKARLKAEGFEIVPAFISDGIYLACLGSCLFR